MEGSLVNEPHNIFPASVTGLPGHPVEDVTLEDIEITYPGGASKDTAYRSPIHCAWCLKGKKPTLNSPCLESCRHGPLCQAYKWPALKESAFYLQKRGSPTGLRF
jgi:hypothetical protein